MRRGGAGNRVDSRTNLCTSLCPTGEQLGCGRGYRGSSSDNLGISRDPLDQGNPLQQCVVSRSATTANATQTQRGFGFVTSGADVETSGTVRCRFATRPLSKDRSRAYGAEAFGPTQRTGRDSLGAIRAGRRQSDVPARSQDRTGTNGIDEKVNPRTIDLRGPSADRRPRSPDDLSSRRRGLHPFPESLRAAIPCGGAQRGHDGWRGRRSCGRR